MLPNDIAIQHPLQPQVTKIGEEQTPVIIFDNFLRETDTIINNACEQSQYGQDLNSYYPGKRAKMPRPYVIKILQAVYQEICRVYDIPLELNLKPQAVFYSLICQNEDKLHVLQRIPHFDSTQPYYFAVLLYLNDNPHGNTGFFKHLPTGYESVSSDKHDEYLQAASEFIRQHGEPAAGYIKGSTAHFKLYEQIEYRLNRLVIYPGNLLHTTLVCPTTDINLNPETGRLTANIFIDFQ